MQKTACFLLSLAMLALLAPPPAHSISATDDADSSALPDVGDPAPPLRLRGLLQAPDDADDSWDALAGHVVVLEFWATWCVPCVAAIPHLNDLAEAMADEPVIFIAITDEDEERVKAFLQRRAMRSWIGIDDDGRTFRAYGVEGRPTTVIVDRDGRIAAFTHPNVLSEDVLRAIMSGEDPGIGARRRSDSGPQVTSPETTRDDASVPEPLLAITIRASRGAEVEGEAVRRPGHIVLPYASLRWAIAEVYRERDFSRVIGADEITQEQFYFEARSQRLRPRQMNTALRNAIEQTFSIHVGREPREVDVFILRLPEDGSHKLAESRKAPMAVAEGNRIEMYHSSVANIAGLARAMLGEPWTPVVDETGLTGFYDFVMIYDHESWSGRSREDRVAEAAAMMLEKYGLVLEPAVRTLEMIVVRPREG